MSRICPNVDCENGELYDEEESQPDVITCPDCGTTLEPFNVNVEDDEEEDNDDEEDGWDNGAAEFDVD